MTASLPSSMRALELRSFNGDLPRPVLTEKPLPKPKPGEVLVKVGAAPINPNDILFLRNQYDIKKSLPVVPGFEGSGTVVASGGGFMARTMIGRRVACAAGDGDGTWAEYVAVPAMQCAPLRGNIDLDAGATMLTNPMTAFVLARRAKKEGHRAVVLTAAAGALGQMLQRILTKQGQAVINVVRRPAQVEALRSNGAAHVLDSSSENFIDELRALSNKLGATLALDAVAGETTGQILGAMPERSSVLVYGMLSNAPCQVDPFELVFRSKRVEGFTMYEWLRTTHLFAQLYAIMSVQGLLRDVLHTRIKARISFAEHARAITTATESTSDGKVLLIP